MSIEFGQSDLHGRGSFATRDMPAGTVVAREAILTFPPEESALLMQTRLRNYLFYLRDGHTEDGPFHSALAFGPVSLCNHATEPSCDFRLSEDQLTIELVARRGIASGEEITIDYGDYAKEII